MSRKEIKEDGKPKKQCNWIMTFEKHLIEESRKRRPRLHWVCYEHAVFRQSQRLILPTILFTPSSLKRQPKPSMHAITNLATLSIPWSLYYKSLTWSLKCFPFDKVKVLLMFFCLTKFSAISLCEISDVMGLFSLPDCFLKYIMLLFLAC